MRSPQGLDLIAPPTRPHSPRAAIIFLPLTLGVVLIGWLGWELGHTFARTLTRRLLAGQALVCGGWFLFLYWAEQGNFPGVRHAFWQATGYTEVVGHRLLFALDRLLPIDPWLDAWSGWFRDAATTMDRGQLIGPTQMLGALLPMALLFTLAFAIQACRQLRAALNPNPEARP